VFLSVSSKPRAPDFRFGLGHPVLEFVATLAKRYGDPLERLATPRDLDRWLDETEIASSARCDEELLADGRRLREAIYDALAAARGNRRPARDDLDLINAWAREPTPAPQIDPQLGLTWAGPNTARAGLARLARAAVELLAGPDLARVHNCDRPGCSLLFIDHSRPGRRRWCSMERCGNRAKTAQYRQRRHLAR
jgi:predicted RNA-binding Zn ribbon-like protein